MLTQIDMDDIMRHSSTCAAHTVDEPVASRREIVTAAVTLAVAATAASGAQAQTSPNLTFSNPPSWGGRRAAGRLGVSVAMIDAAAGLLGEAVFH